MSPGEARGAFAPQNLLQATSEEMSYANMYVFKRPLKHALKASANEVLNLKAGLRWLIVSTVKMLVRNPI